MRIKELQKQAESPDIDLQGLEKIQEEMQAEAATMQELQTKYVQMQETAYKAGQSIGSAIRGIGTSLKGLMQTGLKGTMSALKGITSTGVNAIKGIAGRIKGIGSHVTSIGSKILNLAKSAFIFNMLSGGFRKMADAAKAAFTDYLNYDASLKKSVNSLKSSLNGLGGQLASAFAPILSVVVPMLSTLVNWCVTAANAVAAFIAAITGKSSYKVAVAGLGDVESGAGGAAGGLNDATDAAKKLKKELGGFDELNVISKDTASSAAGGAGGGGGGGGGAGGITYTDAEISSAISDFAEKVKEAWKNADFTEIGGIIGTKLKEALDMIPWGQIQDAAKRVAKSLATLINGFVETEGLADTIGATVAEALNTAIQFAATFAENLHWESVGQFIADQINGTLSRIDWESVLTGAAAIGEGFAKLLNKVFSEETFKNLGTTLGNLLQAAITSAFNFINTVDWSAWGSSLATGVNNLFGSINWETLGTTISNAVKGILSTLTTFFKDVDFKQIGTDLATALLKIDWLGVLEGVGNTVTSALLGAIDLAQGLLDGIAAGLKKLNWTKVANDAWALLQKAWNALGTVVNAAVKLIKSGWTTIAAFVGNAVNVVVSLVKKVAQTIQAWFKEKFGDTVKAFVSLFKEFAQSIQAWFRDNFGDKVKAFVSLFKEVAQTIQTWFKDTFGETVKLFVNLAKGILAGVNSIQEWFKKLWGDAVNLTVKLISAIVQTLQEWFKGVFGTDSVEASLKIISGMTQTLQKWFEDTIGAVVTVTASLVNNVRKLWNKLHTWWKAATADLYLEAEVEPKVTETTTLNNGVTITAEVDLDTHNVQYKLDSEKFSVTVDTMHLTDNVSSEITTAIEQAMHGNIIFDTDQKLEIIAQLAGVDKSKLDMDDLTIDEMFGKIVDVYAQTRTVPTVDVTAKATNWMTTFAKPAVAALFNADAWKQLFPKPGVPSLFNADAWIATFSKPAVRALFNADTWKQLFAKPGVATQFNANTWKQLFSKPGVGAQANLNSVKDQIKAGNKYISGVKAGVTSLKKVGSPTLSFSGNLSRAGGNRYTMSLREHGGVFSHGRWTNIVQYATGGRPSHGTIFAAGENGAEIVGRIGGRTEVLNQSQIASAIFSAVSTAINVTLPHIVSQIVQSNATIASMISGTLNSLSNAFEAYTMPQVNVGLTDTNRINAFREAMTMAIEMDRAVTNAQYAEILSRLDSEEYRFVAQMDGRAIFDEVVSRNDLYRSQTGRTAFA